MKLSPFIADCEADEATVLMATSWKEFFRLVPILYNALALVVRVEAVVVVAGAINDPALITFVNPTVSPPANEAIAIFLTLSFEVVLSQLSFEIVLSCLNTSPSAFMAEFAAEIEAVEAAAEAPATRAPCIKLPLTGSIAPIVKAVAVIATTACPALVKPLLV